MRPPPLIHSLTPSACPPPAEWFPAFAARRGCVWLDSALPSQTARWSILACEPEFVARGAGRTIEVRHRDGTRELHRDQDALPWLRARLAGLACPRVANLPFVGGAIGYLSYEYGAGFEAVPHRQAEKPPVPDWAFGFYDSVVVHDHRTGATHLVAPDSSALSHLMHLIASAITAKTPTCPVHPAQNFSVGPLRADLSSAAYATALSRIRDYIASGDTYQVNFAHRFSAPFAGSTAALYTRLRALSPAPHAAFLDFDDFQLVSSSPERLLRVAGTQLETRPIKGTVARLADPQADAENQARLIASAKDHAELLMIVDLARNDLGRVAATGSVEVTARHDLESYATVHHLVATVRARLAPDLDRFDALAALHPGGSITGAPKIRAMQIIAEVETSRRGAYTGTIGYLGYDGDADFSIAIRTITCAHGQAIYHVGGGITWDSETPSEYEETLQKGLAMHRALDGLQ